MWPKQPHKGACRTLWRRITGAAFVEVDPIHWELSLDLLGSLYVKDVSACRAMQVPCLSLPELLLQVLECSKQQEGKKYKEEKWKPEERNAEENDDRPNVKHHHSLPFFPHLSTTIRATHMFSLLTLVHFLKDRDHRGKML
jgi:hypothetical protein